MKENRRRWSFSTNPMRQPLSSRDTAYWMNQAYKNAKIGIEHEFNLKKGKGTCKGNNDTCPCSHLDAECWKECANKKFCFEENRYEKCENKAINCESNDCTSCEHYKMTCHGLFCSNFVSACLTCKYYHTNCKECPLRYDSNKNPSAVRGKITQALQPSECYGMINSSGVHSVTTDGSLLGGKGVEIITNGRRVDYWEYQQMVKRICNLAMENGAWINERCSIHMHLLMSYYGKVVHDAEKHGIPQRVSELERPMPSIILANLHQLVRRFQNVITWMTMGLNEPNRLTRWEKFRVSVLPFSAILSDMRTVCDNIASNSGKSKYGWINYQYTKFDRSGDVSIFHVEFRVMDGMFVPSVISAVACMFYALFVKAIEISRYGVLEVGDGDWMRETEKIKGTLLNNMKGYDAEDRFGDTSKLNHYYDHLIRESLYMVYQLKPALIKLGPAYEVLEKLAQRPVALHRCDGLSWEEIEDRFEVHQTEESKLEILIKEIIDLQILQKCENFEEWIAGAIKDIENNPEADKSDLPDSLEESVTRLVNEKLRDGEMFWSDGVGAVINVI